MSHFMTAANCALLFIDWQERLFPVMNEKCRDRYLKNAENLHWLAKELDIPVLFSEQYPRGLGATLSALEATAPIEKITFSALQTPEFEQALSRLEKPHVILSGMETHICVAQTARDLGAAGYTVTVVADAVLSRRKLDWKIGLQRMTAEGCRISTTEGVLFEWLQRAGSETFKALSKRIR